VHNVRIKLLAIGKALMLQRDDEISVSVNVAKAEKN